MTKQKISSKVVRARSLAVYELDQFINYVGIIDPELEPNERIVLAAYILSGLPELFKENPRLVNQVRNIAVSMKLKRKIHQPAKN